MNFQERDNNIYEKSNDDRISVYLKNIISRYFDIEKEINDETKEAIIIQAYTRLKQFMATYTNNFVVSLNEKSGSVSISIQDINGEPAFKKNTAYNKDFCDNDTIEQDTIVRGNDIRLSDSREPLIHIHNISDINGLQEEIDKLDVKLDENRHIHHNKNVLDMLRYTGTNTEIDLVLIEYLIQKCKMAVDGFNDMDDYMVNTAKKYINELMYVTIESKKIIQYVKLNVDSWIDWIQDAKEYTDDNKKNAYEIFINVLNDCLSKDEYNNIANTLKNAVTLFKHGTFSYPERYFMYDTLKNYISNTIKDNSEGDYAYLFEDREGTSVLKTKINDFTINVDTTNLKSLLDNTVTVYLTDGSSRTKLPAVIPINKSKHDTLFMTYKLSENTITVYGYRVTELPGLIEQMVPLWAIAEDNAGNKSEYSFMIVPPESKNDYTVCDPKWDAVNALINSAQPDKLTYTGSNTDGSISININASISNSVVNIDWGSSKIPQGTTYKLYKRSIQNDVIGQWEELSNANQSTQLTDTVQDTLPPLLPYISFTNCSAEPLKVKFTPTIQALDSYEVNEYRLIVVSETEANKQLFDTDVALHINCNSGIKSITYDYNFTPGIMTNRVSQNTGANIDYPRYGIQGDRCYLVSNTSKRFNDVFDANAYLSEYNCRLINDSDNISLMSQELMRANSYIDNLLSENGSCVTYRDNTLKDDEYGDRLAIVFDYGKLSDIFGNSLKVEYNIYNIHGNNPLQAVLNDSTSDTSETQPPLPPTGDPT